MTNRIAVGDGPGSCVNGPYKLFIIDRDHRGTAWPVTGKRFEGLVSSYKDDGRRM